MKRALALSPATTQSDNGLFVWGFTHLKIGLKLDTRTGILIGSS